ncbi:MAG: hypothetical protein Q8943_17455 [Bacteroidota bacterium]|nr:hypothetical protein [Bacteroidota bacterium]
MRRDFLYYFVDLPTKSCYYVDATGHVQKASIKSDIDVSLKRSPVRWQDTGVSFGRNSTYMAVNRSFSDPFEFVKDAAKILRSLFYPGRGIEVPLGIVILKLNHATRQYETHYKGNLDLSKTSDKVAEGFSVNVMEGGVLGFLKAFENTIFEIECDGSLSETFPDGTTAKNIKINFDGQLLPDTLYYQFAPISIGGAGATAAVSFIDHDGDNIGIQHGDQVQEFFGLTPNPLTYFQTSGNYLFSSVLPISVRLKGSITVRPYNSKHPGSFALFADTSNSVPIGGTARRTSETNLIPGIPDGPVFPQFVNVPAESTFNFDKTITLGANENLFLVTSFETADGASHPGFIVSGNLQVQFNSTYPATRAWGITGWDLFRVLIKRACQLSSLTSETVNYTAVSQLLQDNLNIVVTCGDALRASGDPGYQKYFNAIQNNPNFPNINQVYSYGPVIKTSIKKFFNSFSTFLMGAMGNQRVPGSPESIFFESLRYVFNSDSDLFDIGEVTDLQISVDLDHIFNILKIGYRPNDYDQVAGKFEPNTTLVMQAPIKTVQKTLEIISDYRTDAYGAERERSSIGTTSTQQNSGDSDVWAIDVDLNKFIFDFFNASFISRIPDPTNVDNTNVLLKLRMNQQPVLLSALDGGYFQTNTDFAIQVFNQTNLVAHFFAATFQLAGTLVGLPANALTGLPADSVTVKLWLNGAVLNSWNFPVTGPLTNWDTGVFHFDRNFNYKDCMYVTVSTTVNGTANITAGAFQIDAAGAYATLNTVGITTVKPGTPQQLISFPTISGIHSKDANGFPVISSGFQYFVFNDIVKNSNFDVDFTIAGFLNGAVANSAGIDLFLNGVVQDSAVWPTGGGGSAIPATAFHFNRDFQLGDIIFIAGSNTNVSAWFTDIEMKMTSTTIKAYSLKRDKYDVITGIPVLSLDANGNPDSSLPGAPYNLFFTPKRRFNAWSGWLRSMLFNQIPGKLLFSTLDKNQFLSTTKDGVTITENADVDISTMDAPIIIPLILKAKTQVPETFNKLMTGAANAHIGFKYNGKSLFGFCNKMTQKSLLNEAQEWELLGSPKINLQDLVDLHIDGINFLQMAIYNISASLLNPIKLVPDSPPADPRYSNLNMDQDLFKNRHGDWTDSSDYAALWLQSDTIKLQILSYGLGPVVAQLYDWTDKLVNTFNFALAASPAISAPFSLYEVSIPLAAIAQNVYYFKIVAGAGLNIAKMRSEPIRVMPSWPLRTLLLEYTNTDNDQDTMFDTGFSPSIRVEGWIDNFNPEGVYSSFADQQQDFVVIKGIPYRKYKLNVGINPGIPDYMIDQIARIFLLDTVKVNGVQLTRAAADTQFEANRTPGQPKDLWTLDIREAVSRNSLTVGIDGGVNNEVTVVATIDADAFGENDGTADLIQVNLNA